jgi:hypothetical protein
MLKRIVMHNNHDGFFLYSSSKIYIFASLFRLNISIRNSRKPDLKQWKKIRIKY